MVTRAPIPVWLVIAYIVMATAEANVSCNEVVSDLLPCVSCVLQGGVVPVSCCNGISALNGNARTASDRQAVCRCLKSALSGVSYSDYSLRNAASLPSKCGLHLPYSISPSTSCESIN